MTRRTLTLERAKVLFANATAWDFGDHYGRPELELIREQRCEEWDQMIARVKADAIRDHLLSDESVERAARALYAEDVNESMDTPWPDYDSPKNVGRPLYEERARNALLSAIEGEQ